MAAIVSSSDFIGRINIATRDVAVSQLLEQYCIECQEELFKKLFGNKDYDTTSITDFDIKAMIANYTYSVFITEYKTQATATGEKIRNTTGTTNAFNVSKYINAYNTFVDIYNSIADGYLVQNNLPLVAHEQYVNRFGI